MEHKIPCGVCRDLLPLARDGIATEDSQRLVEEHLRECPTCRALWEGELPPSAADGARAFQKAKGQLRLLMLLLLIFGIFFGLSLTAGENIFYNLVIMPVLGGLGYLIFRWHALWAAPLLVTVSHGGMNLWEVAFGAEQFDFWSLFWWTAIYCGLSILGTVIAGLLRYGIKGKGKRRALRAVSCLTALALLLGIGWFANAFVGNPVSKALAIHGAQEYLAETHPGAEYTLGEVNYSFMTGGYYVDVTSPESPDSAFSLDLSMRGEVLYDDYADRVLTGENTARRLNEAYRALVDTAILSPAFPYELDKGVGFGELIFGYPYQEDPDYAIPMASLEVDQVYDIPALGAQAGKVVLYITDEDPTPARKAEVLGEIESFLSEAGVTWREIDLHLY